MLALACAESKHEERFLLFTSEAVLAYPSQAACERRERESYWIITRVIPRPNAAIIGNVLYENELPCRRWRLTVVGIGVEDDGTATRNVSKASRVSP
ncbi:MAG: hypothetical protein IT383_05720 [Deltaproteobacteria bacterium]|nr:hypothetical protein [Deltaproteobacteria bacterium]